MSVRAMVLRTAGTNCDAEAVRALELAGAEVELVYQAHLAAEPARLAEQQILVLPGGFSHGDYVAAGRVFGLELRRTLARELADFVAGGGHVLGICNGFQVLLETDLFDLAGAPGGPPGTGSAGARRDCTLERNESDRFECRWVALRAEACACTWLPAGELPMPVAHAEGRFSVRGPGVLARLAARGQIALRYVAPGRPGGAPARYPDNPNGSAGDVAGLCDPTGRVLGLMPHPERNTSPWHHPRWTRLPRREHGEGLQLFRRLVAAAGAASASLQRPTRTPTPR